MYNLGRFADVDSIDRRLRSAFPPTTPNDSVGSIANAGLLAARLGRRQEAEDAMTKLAGIHGTWPRGAPTRWRAAIAAVLGERDRAVDLLRQAFAEGMVSPRWELHTDIEFSGLKGYPPFEALMIPPG